MSDDQLTYLLRFFKALAHESRLRIVGLLAQGPLSVGELAERLDLKEPTVSHHLALLRALDLVMVEPRSNLHIYHLNANALRQLSQDLLSPEQTATLAPPQPRSWEEKVLATFVEDGRIKLFPAKQKKQLVVLAWLAEQFAAERAYSEAEVNAIISPIYPDTAYLRRRLISFGFLSRENGIYHKAIDN